MNDNLLIRDKRYIINEMKTDLTTGECDLVLINNFRPAINYDVYVESNADGGKFTVPVPVPEDTGVVIDSVPFEATVFTTLSTKAPTGQAIVEVTVDPNKTFSPRFNTYPMTVTNRNGTFTFYFVIYQEGLVS